MGRMIAMRVGAVGWTLLLACSSGVDSEERPTSPARMGPAGRQPAVNECLSTPLPGQLYPETPPIVYAPFESPCGSVKGGASMVLANTSQAPLRIEQVETAGPFTASVENLPRELAPRERLVIALAYESTGPSREEGSLKISSADRCAKLMLLGSAPDPKAGGYIVYEPSVIDFGSVPAGSASEPATLVIHQDSGPLLRPTLKNFFVEPDEIFDLVSAPDKVELDGCAETSIEVRFNAPVEPGFVAGGLGWDLSIEGKQGTMTATRYYLLGDSE